MTDKIPIINKADRKFLINLVDNHFDVYRSPHLLDLSGLKFIEKVKPQEQASLSYGDLPYGRILSKSGVFSLLDFEKSEILLAFKSLINHFLAPFRGTLEGYQLIPSLNSAKKNKISDHTLIALSEVSFINLALFFWSIIKRIYLNTAWSLKYVYVATFKPQDEVLELIKGKPLLERRVMPVRKEDGGVVDIFDGLDEKRLAERKVLPESRREEIPHLNFKQKINLFSKFSNFYPKFSLKPLVIIALLVLAVAIPLKTIDYWQNILIAKGKILGETEQALGDLNAAKDDAKDFNLKGAENYLAEANNKFVSAQKQLEEIKSFLTFMAEVVPAQNTFKSGKNILDLGEHLSSAGEHILKGINEFSSDSGFSLASKMKNFKVEAGTALGELELAQENLNNVNVNHLPEDNRQKFLELKASLPIFISSLKQFQEVSDFAINFIGDEGLKRYLLVFQNNNELRPTGGFMGSFALVDLRDGKIEKINLPQGGTYDVRAGFSYLLKPPKPISIINDRWEFQDSNWWPDFPTSAKAVQWFYNKSGGPTIDGVIAINSSWMSGLLKVVGPIDLPAYGKTITADNFELELQKSIELEHEDKNKPKKILADLAPQLLQRILDAKPDQILSLATVIGSGLKEKNILVYLENPQSQSFIAKNNWDGRIKSVPENTDYLSVIATNISGGKSDSAIKQKIYHRAEIMPDGTIIDQVLVDRYHFGPIDQYFTNASNNTYLRFYVPKGSKLIKAVGFNPPPEKDYKTLSDKLTDSQFLLNEAQAQTDDGSQTAIYEENGKTVFGNWLRISPQEEKQALLVYELPFKISPPVNQGLDKILAAFTNNSVSYSLLTQKQPGVHSEEFSSEVVLPDNYDIGVVYPKGGYSLEGKRVSFSNSQPADDFYFLSFNNSK